MRVGLLVLLVGCGFSGNPGTPRDGSVHDTAKVDTQRGDAPVGNDAATDAPANATCYGTGIVAVCVLSPPNSDLVSSAAIDIDTDASSMCAPTTGGTMPGNLCAVLATNIQLSGGLTAHGSKPLVLVSTSAIGISAPLDVASHAGGQVGAGHGTAANCDLGTAPDAATKGGAGGSFGTVGGGGGNSGGSPGMIVNTPGFRGGCRGQPGGGTAIAGEGGGAIALIAATTIVVNSTINASGAGGGGASQDEGGGGGGAGGMIVLDAPTIMVKPAGKLIANGGGGGEGGGNGAGQNGNPGLDPSGLGPAAGGKDGAPSGGDGGNGAAANSVGANGNVNSASGGGAGGGEGVIKAYPAQSLANASPPAS